MKTRFYHILNKNNEVIYVGLTTTTINKRFCRHIISKNLNRVDYKCIQIDEIDNGKITSLEDYYREKKRAGDLEKYYIMKAQEEGANLMNISVGGEWNSHILSKLLKKDFFENYGTYDGFLEYKKEYEHQNRMKRKYQTFIRNWIYNRCESKYRKFIRNWINLRLRNKYKVLLYRWVYKRTNSKYKIFIRHWIGHRKSKYKRFLSHWIGHRIENRYRNFWEYRIQRKMRNRYHYFLSRLIIRRTYEAKQKQLKEQGLLIKKPKIINKYKELLYNWHKRNSMNPLKKFLFGWIHRRIKQQKQLAKS